MCIRDRQGGLLHDERRRVRAYDGHSAVGTSLGDRQLFAGEEQLHVHVHDWIYLGRRPGLWLDDHVPRILDSDRTCHWRDEENAGSVGALVFRRSGAGESVLRNGNCYLALGIVRRRERESCWANADDGGTDG